MTKKALKKRIADYEDKIDKLKSGYLNDPDYCKAVDGLRAAQRKVDEAKAGYLHSVKPQVEAIQASIESLIRSLMSMPGRNSHLNPIPVTALPGKVSEFMHRLCCNLQGGRRMTVLWHSPSCRYVIIREPGDSEYRCPVTYSLMDTTARDVVEQALNPVKAYTSRLSLAQYEDLRSTATKLEKADQESEKK